MDKQKSAIKEALAYLGRYSFFIGLYSRNSMTLLMDHAGEIIWVNARLPFQQNFEAANFLQHKNIAAFFALGPLDSLVKQGKIKMLDALVNEYAEKNILEGEFSHIMDPPFPSRNMLEPVLFDYPLTTEIPFSNLRLVRLPLGHLLGFITFNMRLGEIGRWSSEINLLLDENNFLVGFDERFRKILEKEPPVLHAPISQYLQTDFLDLKPSFSINQWTGKLGFQFPDRGAGTAPHFNGPFFKADAERIECRSGASPSPALMRIPILLDMENHDYLIEIEAENISGEPPLCILNGDALDGPSFPDDRGFLFAPFPFTRSANYAESGKISFLLKHSTQIVEMFNQNSFLKKELGGKTNYVIYKQGRTLAFEVNQKLIGCYFAEEMKNINGYQSLIVGLRGGGNACVFTKIKVKETAQGPDHEGPPAYITRFHGHPEKTFKVNARYLFQSIGSLTKSLKWLRLEDLSIKEELRELTRLKQEQSEKIRRLESHLLERKGLERIVGNSMEIEKVKQSLSMMSQSSAPVLLSGETGTGKSMMAEVIHELSPRRDKPFVKVDCSNLPESLIESELFGFEKGAFTGAVHPHAGKFEQANGGTIFLDEISNIGLHIQAKLLNVVQDMVIQRLGGTGSSRLDIRIIAATNKNLEALVKQGQFRSDLFYRLNVLHLEIPALRQRMEDIPLLCAYLLKNEFARHSRVTRAIAPGVYKKLMAYGWPGNIRELGNILLKAVVLCENKVLQPSDVSLPSAPAEEAEKSAVAEVRKKMAKKRKRISLEMILDEIKACNGNMCWAADRLQIAPTTLYYHLKKEGIGTKELRFKMKQERKAKLS